MKKYLILLLLFTNCILMSCQNKSNENDLEKENLKGNIVSVRQTRYKVSEKFGEPVKGEKDCVDLNVCEIITKYNNLGNEIEFTEYDSFGVSFITKIKYDEKNLKIEQNRYTPVEGKRVMQFKLKNDSNGNCIELSSDYGYIEKKFYDKKNNLIKELIKNSPTEEFNDYYYFYNEKNQKMNETYTNGQIVYSYFEDGNIKEMVYYDKDGKVETKGSFTYEYDEHKNWKTQIAYENGIPSSYSERIIEYKN